MKKVLVFLCVSMVLGGVIFANGTDERGTTSSTKATQPLTLTFSNGSLATSLDGQSMQKMVDYVKDASKNTIVVDPHWQNSLFTQDQEIPALMKGNLDMCQAQPSQLAEYFPQFYTLTGAYCFKDYEHWKRFYESDAAKELFVGMEKELGITVLSVENFGARTISLSEDKKIASRADMKNVKLRVMNDSAMLFMGEALGANPIPLPYPDVYLSLQTGAIDGQENVIRTIIDNSYYEVLKSVTLNNHIQGTNYYVINTKKWNTLSADQQAIVKKGAEICADYKTGESTKEEEICKVLEEKGMKIYHLSDQELSSYSKEVNDYYLLHPEVTDKWDMDLYAKIQALK